ncbi:hypothetical protein BC827DRAFT_1266663 [Russula dissimulans]|nr:hypothetical protein BC827DRAFT_1266663 [Russula dissimulans]
MGMGWMETSAHLSQQPPSPPHQTSFNSQMADSERAYKFDVKMTCGGCSGAVNRALKKAQDNDRGISSFEVKLETQEVFVNGSIPYEDAVEVIKKTGKEVRSGEVIN